MADNKKARVQRTDAERIAALEEQLAAVRNRGAIKDGKRRAVLMEQREKLVAQITERTDKVEVIDQEISAIDARTPVAEPAPETEEN